MGTPAPSLLSQGAGSAQGVVTRDSLLCRFGVSELVYLCEQVPFCDGCRRWTGRDQEDDADGRVERFFESSCTQVAVRRREQRPC